MPIPFAMPEKFHTCAVLLRTTIALFFSVSGGVQGAAAATDELAGFAARRELLLARLNADWVQPFPDFGNAQMHYYVTALALLADAAAGVEPAALLDGDRESKRPPIYWGILKYDGEPIPAAGETVARGQRKHEPFAAANNLFHFNFPGLAALLGLYPQLTAWDQPHHRYPEQSYRTHYLRAVLQRKDNYNAFTGEGTENHLNMSRPPAWVLASEAQRMGVIADDALYSAAERKDQMKAWMRAWAQLVYTVGIGEWDSGIYHAVSMQGWFVAYDYAHTAHGWDPEVQAIARAVLDYYAAILAWKHFGWQMGGAEKRGARAYDSLNTGSAWLAWLWFAEDKALPAGPFKGGTAGEVIFAAMSRYRPPQAIVDLARRSGRASREAAGWSETYTALRPDYLLQNPAQTVETLHLGPGYMLGSANMAIGGFFSSSRQVIPWKLMVAGGNPATPFPAVFSGNGGFYGPDLINGRDPWMQLVQHRNVLIQMHRVPPNAWGIVREVESLGLDWIRRWHEDFTARWPSPDWGGFRGDRYRGRPSPIAFMAGKGDCTAASSGHLLYPPGTEIELDEKRAFLRYADTYLAVHPLSGRPLQHDARLRTLRDAAEIGVLSGLLLEVGTAADWGGFAEFKVAVIESTSLVAGTSGKPLEVHYTSLSGEQIRAVYQIAGSWSEPAYDMNFGVRDRYGIALQQTARLLQIDWPTGEGHGRQPTWFIDAQPVNPAEWLPLSGPRLQLVDRVLRVFKNGECVYRVDFSGPLPVFADPS